MLPLLLSSGGGSGRLRGGESAVDYYVFGLEEDSDRGFIVVSGDDRGRAVLGYSLDAQFDADSLPEGMRYWLEVCSQYMEQVRNRRYARADHVHSNERIAPLLGRMMWNQGKPFNKFTPREDGQATPVGCVSTALSQIMRYHCWPKRGRGMVTYELGIGGGVAEKLGAHVYDWESMPARYTSSSSVVEEAAVARLMYEVGVASKMQYAAKGSGAHSHEAAQAMRTHFRYSPTLRFVPRSAVENGKWEDLILEELRAKRPVYYAGASVKGAHAFVCDGYDGRGYFHFNWGWGGMSNGYFSLLDLEPKVQGIGAGSGSGYVLEQEVMVGIQPDTVAKVKEPLSICVDSVYVRPGTHPKNTKLKVRLSRFISYSLYPVTIEPGVGVYSEDGQLVRAFGVETTGELEMYHYFRKIDVPFDASSLPDGKYRLRPIVRKAKDQWQMTYVSVYMPPYLGIEVSGDQLIVSTWQKPAARLKGQLRTSELLANSPNQLRFSIKNEGEGEFTGFYSLRLMRGLLDTGVTSRDQLLLFSAMQVLPGQEVSQEAMVSLANSADATHLELRYLEEEELGEADYEKFIPSRVLGRFPVQMNPAGSFTDTVPPACRVLYFTNRLNGGEPLRLSVEVTSGTSYGLASNFGVFVGGGTITKPRRYGAQSYILLPGQVDTLHFAIEMALPEGEYEALLGVYNSAKSHYEGLKGGSLPFRVESVTAELPVKPYNYPPDDDQQSEVSNVLEGLSLDPNPAGEWAVLRMRDGVLALDWVRLLSLSGQEVWRAEGVRAPELGVPVANLPVGIYVLQVCRGGELHSLRLVVNR